MFNTVVFVLISAMIVICVQSGCDEKACTETCKKFGLDGKCNVIDKCDCDSGQSCINMICKAFCEPFDLKGECIAHQCICRAELELCYPNEWSQCEIGCWEHKPPQCIYVQVEACLKYGPVLNCDCLCFTLLDKFTFFPSKKSLSHQYNISFSQNDV